MTARDTDVVIVGAGPTGLWLAGDLAAAGVACVVLERRTEESNLSRAFAVHARTLEGLDARGLADDLVATGQPIQSVQLFGQVQLDLSALPSRFPYLLVTPQYHIERLLEERARRLGATIVRGARVTGLRQDADGVDIATVDGDYRAAYVVGADGVRSSVRQSLGLPYPGKSVLRSIMLADVRLAEPPAELLTVYAGNAGIAVIAPYGDGWYRIFAWNRHRQLSDDAPVDFDEVREVTRRVIGTDYGMHDPRALSRFHSDERQAPRYRVGRVFLAGDAAHCHSPAGGQGMNTGLQDAANLSWKLAAAVHGWASADLLDTYQAERHPVGTLVLRSSGAILRLVKVRTSLQRSVRNFLAGTALRVPRIARRVAGTISGIGLGYRTPQGGQRAADVPLSDGRLYEALRDGQFVLVAPPGISAEGWAGRVKVVNPAKPTDVLTLVRPDGYVAWAGDSQDGQVLRTVLSRWCGRPAEG